MSVEDTPVARTTRVSSASTPRTPSAATPQSMGTPVPATPDENKENRSVDRAMISPSADVRKVTTAPATPLQTIPENREPVSPTARPVTEEGGLTPSTPQSKRSRNGQGSDDVVRVEGFDKINPGQQQQQQPAALVIDGFELVDKAVTRSAVDQKASASTTRLSSQDLPPIQADGTYPL